MPPAFSANVESDLMAQLAINNSDTHTRRCRRVAWNGKRRRERKRKMKMKLKIRARRHRLNSAFLILGHLRVVVILASSRHCMLAIFNWHSSFTECQSKIFSLTHSHSLSHSLPSLLPPSLHSRKDAFPNPEISSYLVSNTEFYFLHEMKWRGWPVNLKCEGTFLSRLHMLRNLPSWSLWTR